LSCPMPEAIGLQSIVQMKRGQQSLWYAARTCGMGICVAVPVILLP
jgi:hypothetical protein